MKILLHVVSCLVLLHSGFSSEEGKFVKSTLSKIVDGLEVLDSKSNTSVENAFLEDMLYSGDDNDLVERFNLVLMKLYGKGSSKLKKALLKFNETVQNAKREELYTVLLDLKEKAHLKDNRNKRQWDVDIYEEATTLAFRNTLNSVPIIINYIPRKNISYGSTWYYVYPISHEPVIETVTSEPINENSNTSVIRNIFLDILLNKTYFEESVAKIHDKLQFEQAEKDADIAENDLKRNAVDEEIEHIEIRIVKKPTTKRSYFGRFRGRGKISNQGNQDQVDDTQLTTKATPFLVTLVL